MDRQRTYAAFCSGSVRSHRADPLYLLLSAEATERYRFAFNDISRRDLHRETVLRIAKHHCYTAEEGTQCQSQADSGHHARAGVSRAATRTQHFQKSPSASQVPLSVERCCDLQTDASVELRHYVHSAAGGVCVSHSSDRLVQPIRPFSQAVKQLGGCVLYRSFRGSGRALREPRDIQHRSRGPVLFGRFCQCDTEQGDTIQHGRKRQSPGQYFRGALMEIGEV
jgi:hypothetical protein